MEINGLITGQLFSFRSLLNDEIAAKKLSKLKQTGQRKTLFALK